MERKNLFLRLFFALAALSLLVAACGEDEEPEPVGGDTETEGTGGEFTTLEDGVLLVGSDYPYPPFEFEEGGELTGFDVDLVRAIADKLELENTDDHWQSVDFGTIFQQLRSGTKFDLVAAAVT